MDVRELLLLGFVLRRKMHGYELVKFIEQRIGFLLDLKTATAYSILDRLERQGYLIGEIGREGNRPQRKVYRITANGEARFRQLLLENLTDFTPALFPDEVGTYFMDQLAQSDVRTALESKLSKIKTQLAEFQESAGRHVNTPARWMFSHHLKMLESERDWLEDTLKGWEFQPDAEHT